MPDNLLLRSLVLLFAIAAVALASSHLASADQPSSSYTWRSDLLSPAVRDATGSPAFWRVPDAVAEWRGLDPNINPEMSFAGRADILVSERHSTRWLGKTQVFVRAGYVTRARLLLNPSLKHAPYTGDFAQHVLCQQMGAILGLRGDSACTRADGLEAMAPTAQDEVQLAKLYSAIASSVSNESSRAFLRGQWITVHIVPVP